MSDVPGTLKSAEEVNSQREKDYHQSEPQNLSLVASSYQPIQKAQKKGINSSQKNMSLSLSCDNNQERRRNQIDSSNITLQRVNNKQYEVSRCYEELPLEMESSSEESGPSKNRVADIHSIPPEGTLHRACFYIFLIQKNIMAAIIYFNFIHVCNYYLTL